MKSYLIIIFLILLSIKCFSQKTFNTEKTIFVLFEGSKSFSFKEKINKKSHIRYYYKFKDYYELILNFNEFRNFNEQNIDNPLPYFRVNKSFLRKNHDIIYDDKKLKTLGYKNVVKLFKNAKHIFLIDKKEIYKNKIIIKEVIYFNANQIE